MSVLQGKRVAIVHDYLVDGGGAEKVVEALSELFPDAPVFTSIYNPQTTLPSFARRDIRVSFLQKITKKKNLYKFLLPLYPLAFEKFDLSGYDIVLSSSSSFAKGVVTAPEACHICYCHSPSRFLWRYNDYIQREGFGRVARGALSFLTGWLRVWDFNAAQRVDYYIANSAVTAGRIKKFYRRDAVVIAPPVDVEKFRLSPEPRDYYLIVSRLIPYKRIDLAVEAFNRLGFPLYIIGDGPDRKRLEGLARPNIRFLGRIADEELARCYSQCLAFVFPGEEDFGLTPLEANASGRPVIAYAKAGALETVVEGKTGGFFFHATPDSLSECLKRFDPLRFEPETLREHAMRFDKEAFKKRVLSFVEEKYAEYKIKNIPIGIEEPLTGV